MKIYKILYLSIVLFIVLAFVFHKLNNALLQSCFIGIGIINVIFAKILQGMDK